MANRPYEEEQGFIPNIAMAGIITGGGYVSYKAIKSEGWVTEKLTTVKNKIYPMKEQHSNLMETMVTNTFNSVKKGLSFAELKKKATYKDRRDIKIMKFNELENMGVIARDISLDPSRVLSSVGQTEAHTFTHIGFDNIKGGIDEQIKAITDIHGNSIGDKIVEKLTSTYGLKRTDLSFHGTTLRVNTGGTKIDIPLSQYDEKVGAMISRQGGNTHYVAPYFRSPKIIDGKMVGSSFIDFNTAVLESLSDETRGLIYANAGEDLKNSRDIIEHRTRLAMPNKDKQIKQAIETMQRKIEAGKIIDDVSSLSGLKRMMSWLSDNRYNISANDLPEGQRIGRTTVMDPHGLWMAKEAGFDGAMETSMSPNTISYYGEKPKNAVVEGRTLDALADLDRVTRESDVNDFFPTKGVFSERARKISGSIKKYLAGNVSQGQRARWTSSFFGAMTENNAVDAVKSVKGYEFTSSLINKERSLPLIWNNETQAANSMTYDSIRKKGSATIYGILSNRTTETIAIAPSLGEDMVASRAMNIPIKAGYAGLPTEVEAKGYKMNVNYKIGNKWHSDKTMMQLYEDTDILSKVDEINADPRTIFGTTPASYQINNPESFDDALKYKDGFVTNDSKFVQGREDIERTAKYLVDREKRKIMNPNEVDDMVFYGRSEEAVTKLGTYHQRRSAIRVLGESEYGEWTRGMSKYLREMPMGEVSLDLYEKVFLGENKIGKSGGELLTTLQSLVAGHAYGAKGDVILDSMFAKSISPYIVGGKDFDGNLSRIAKSGKLQFNQRAGGVGEQVDLFQRILGSMRNTDLTQTGRIGLNSNITLDQAGTKIHEDLISLTKGKDIQPFHGMFTLSPQETVYTQGMGSNIYRMGIKDKAWLMPPSVMQELASNSLTNTTKLMSEYSLYMDAGKSDISEGLSKLEIKTLNKDGIDKMLGSLVKGSDIENPSILAKTFLNPEINPNGFAVGIEDGGTMMFGSAEFNAQSQYLADEGRMTVEASTRNEVKTLLRASQNGGIISKKDADALWSSRQILNMSPKEGALSRSGLQIEGAFFNKNISDTGFLNNKKIIENIDSAGGEIADLFGHSIAVDKETFKKGIFNELKEAEIMASQSNGAKSRLDILKDKFGEGTIFENYSGTSDEIATSITEQSVKDFKTLQTHVKSRQFSEASELIKAKGMATFVDRFPNIYSSSEALGFAFATDEGYSKGGKFAAFGNKISTLMGADTDGDNIFTKFLFMKHNRDAAYNRILREQKISYEVFQKNTADKKGLSILFGDGKDGKYFLPRSENFDSVIAAMQASDKESSLAAVITKNLTGGAHVRTQEITSGLMERLVQNKSITSDEALKSLITAIDIPAKEIEQGVLSSKHLETILGKDSKISHMVGSIGKVSRGDMLAKIEGLSGEVGGLFSYSVIKGIEQNADFLTEGHPQSILPQVKTIIDQNMGWRKSSESELRALYNELPGYKDNKPLIDQRINSYNEWAKDHTFKSQTPEWKALGAKEGQSYFDFLNEVKKSTSFYGGDSYDSMNAQAQKVFSNSSNKLTIEEIMADLQGQKLNRIRAAGHDAFTEAFGRSSLTKHMAQREFVGAELIRNTMSKIGPITAGKVGGAIGLGLAAITALNLIGGDGTPEDINDLPSVSNPSFEGPSYNNGGHMMNMSSSPSQNMSVSLLTDNRQHHGQALQSISALYGSHNTVSIRSDGTDPYKSDMYKYSS